MSPRAGLAALVIALVSIVPLRAQLPADGHTVALGSPAQAPLPIIKPSAPRHVSSAEFARSRRVYSGASQARAARIALRSFPTPLGRAPQGLPDLPAGTRITGYLNDHTARIFNGHRHGLVSSTLPLRVRVGAGKARPVDLRLRTHGGSIVPRRPLVPTNLPRKLARGVGFAGLLQITPETAPTRQWASARALGSSRLIYPDVAADTDFIAEPTLLGFEAYWQLRSPESPELQILRQRPAPGVALRADHLGIALVKRGRTIGRILPPRAVDAAGRAVPVRETLVGNDLELVVSHRRANVRYPVLVDPGYVTDDWSTAPTWRQGVANGLEAWSSYSNNGIIYTANECDPTSLQSDCDDLNVLGLFITAHTGWFTNGQGAFWQYQAQGQGASTYIDSLQGAYVVVSSNGGPATTSASMYIANSAGTPLSGSNYGFGSNWGSGNPAVSSGGGGTLARFQLTMSGDGQRSTYNTMSVGGALVQMYENSAPALSGDPQLSWSPSTWYTGGQTLTANPTFLNTGFGVARNEWITYKPGDWVPQSRQVRDQALTIPQDGCDGTYLHRCNYSWQTEMAIPTAQMPEGVNTVQLSAYSPSGKGSDAWGNGYSYNVDHSAPTLALSGSLYDARDTTLTRGRAYTLTASAEDWANAPSANCSDRSPSAQRSGVSSVSIEIDGGGDMPLGSTQGVGTCSYSPSYTFNPDNFSAGPHQITVTATDHMGLAAAPQTFTIIVPIPLPSNNTAPSISGTAQEGEDLTASAGVWSGATTLGYQWQRCDVANVCSDIPGATSTSYHVFFADVGYKLRVAVTATNASGTTPATSSMTATVGSIAPSLPDKNLDQVLDTAVPDDGGAPDGCVADTSYSGGDDCTSDATNPLYASEAQSGAASPGSSGSYITHRGYGMSQDYRYPDSLALFGGPYLKDGTCSTDPASAGEFSRTSPSEQTQPDSRFTSLGASGTGVTKVRLIVPYDIMDGKSCTASKHDREMFYRVSEFIAGATATQKPVLVSFDESMENPATLPDITTYGNYVQAFRDEFTQVLDYTAWNEPNRSDEPTHSDPARAAHYWVHLHWRCNHIGPTQCRVAAGDFLDSPFNRPLGDMDPYFKSYRDGLHRHPGIWALHAYTSIRRRTTVPVDRFMKWTGDWTIACNSGQCAPRVWLTEQGGLVYRQSGTTIADGARCDNTDPTNGYEANIARAGADLQQFFNSVTNSASTNGATTRFYYYSWAGTPTFDSGLVNTAWHGSTPCPEPGKTRDAIYNVFHDEVVGAPLP